MLPSPLFTTQSRSLSAAQITAVSMAPPLRCLVKYSEAELFSKQRRSERNVAFGWLSAFVPITTDSWK
ncbi:hypothetical protein EYF80_052127 [Liparis tanakae]|uniref:Uncharacterized protein n=1 Tax=Liparis tanakae TaxID=230148 RepID=A0A4Z2FA83_9TELE|nr:hypothetical protein EYF80_052127 [Liparis tanakae]